MHVVCFLFVCFVRAVLGLFPLTRTFSRRNRAISIKLVLGLIVFVVAHKTEELRKLSCFRGKMGGALNADAVGG